MPKNLPLSSLPLSSFAISSMRWLCVLAWMAVIFAFSSQAHSGEVTKHYLGDFNVPVRKAAHMTEYAILFFLTRWAAFGTIHSASIRRWLPLLWSIAYACTDEYHQNFVPGRSATVSDVLVDSVGACLGWLIVIGKNAVAGKLATKK